MDSALANEQLAGRSSPETERETAWISASQRGDALAFNRLVLKWEKPIYNLALRMLQDSEEAAESAQEVFLSAYRNIRRFRQDSRFSTWLYRIAVNQCISRLRRRPPGAHYSLDDEEAGQPLASRLRARESQEQELLQQESRRRVREALDCLPADQRAVIELKFFQELTFEEIAAILETPLSTVKTRLYGGLEVLKNRLGHIGTAL